MQADASQSVESKSSHPNAQQNSAIAVSDYVSERERLELEALYPSVLQDKLKPFPSPTKGKEDPSFYLLVGNDQVETKLNKSSDAIDFGYPSLRITSLEFVGLRYVPHRISNFTSSLSSSSSSFSDAPYTSRNNIRKVLMSILQFYRKSITSSPPNSSLKSSNQSFVRSKQSKNDQIKSSSSPNLESSNSNSNSESNKEAVKTHTSEVIHYIQKEVEDDIASSSSSRRRMTWGGSDALSKNESGLPTWELMWKEGGRSSPLKRLRFQTDAVGFLHLSSKLDSWSMAAHTDQIMTHAAMAALSITQDKPTNTEPSQTYKPPINSSSPSSPSNSSFPSEPSPSISKSIQSLTTSFKGTATAIETLSQNMEIFASSFFKSKNSQIYKEEDGYNPNPNPNPDPNLHPNLKPIHSSIFPSFTVNVHEKTETFGQVEAARAAHDILLAEQEEKDSKVSKVSKVLPPEHFISWGSVTVEGKYLPTREGQSLILKDDHFKALAVALPARFRSCSWMLLYSTARDGISLNTLYRKVNKKGPSVLVVRDSKKYIFGCFCSEEWKTCTRYYGNGECYVFQVQPELRAFKWTRENNYFMFSHSEFLAMGGGSHYGLLLNSDLLSGYSGECETFANKSLSNSEDFEIAQVEVWGFK